MVFERIDTDHGNFSTEELNPTPGEIRLRVQETITEFQGIGSGCWILDAGYSLLDARCWILDAGCYDAGCGMLDSMLVYPESSIKYPVSDSDTDHRIPITDIPITDHRIPLILGINRSYMIHGTTAVINGVGEVDFFEIGRYRS